MKYIKEAQIQGGWVERCLQELCRAACEEAVESHVLSGDALYGVSSTTSSSM